MLYVVLSTQFNPAFERWSDSPSLPEGRTGVTNLVQVLGHISQWVACLTTDARLTADPTTDARLTADPGSTRLIPALSHTFIEIDHEIISMASLLPSAESFKNGCF